MSFILQYGKGVNDKIVCIGYKEAADMARDLVDLKLARKVKITQE